MEHIIRILTFALIPIIVNGVFVFLRQPKAAEKGKVYLPKFFAILGAITSSIFLVPAIITAFSDEDVWVPICFLAFSLLGVTLIIAFMNCRISYNDDKFVVKTFFGIKRKWSYDQVTAIKENMHETYIYMGKRRVMVDELRNKGEKVGLLKVRAYRPFPVEAIEEAVKNASKLAVLDKNVTFGIGGALYTDIKAKIHKEAYGFIIGLGGRDITPESILDVYEKTKNPEKEVSWIGLKEE